jgi:RNA polymerase sigma factor (TIGR02999 family)
MAPVRAHTASVTQLLADMKDGDAAALSQVIPLVYDELRRVARAHLRREGPGHVLQTTGLVHEAYLKLAGLERVSVVSRTHLLALCARLMRQVLVDQARRKRADKRGAGVTFVGLEGVSPTGRNDTVDVLAVDEALTRLAGADPRQARIVELRFFAGLTADETAGVLGISLATLHREWAMAKAWLLVQLRSDSSGPSPAA